MLCFEILFFLSLAVVCFSVVSASSCSQKAFKEDAQNCVNRFYAELRQNPEQDCRRPYSELRGCVENSVDKCKDKTDKRNLTIMENRSVNIIASRNYYCKDGMLNSFKNSKLPDDCQARARYKVKKCVGSFHKEFRDNMGSPSLCRKFTKAKECISRVFPRFCKKTDTVDKLLKLYQDSYNPHCPTGHDIRKPPVRSPIKPYGSCSERKYLISTRICLSSFVRTLQTDSKKSCRWAFVNKLHNCAKNIVKYCFKNASRDDKKNIEKGFANTRAYQERKYCGGINFQLSYPRLRHNQCEKKYVTEKEACESNYVAAYKQNKADRTLCRKYAEAKRCAKNASLNLCTVTPELLDQVDFIYDSFNPFCSLLTDPPLTEKSPESGERIPRNSKDPENTLKPITQRVTGSPTIASVAGGQLVSAKPFSLLVFVSLLLYTIAIS